MDKKYKLLVLAGPSACGKDRLKTALLEQNKKITNRVISCTTRPKREGEVDGQEYIFLTYEEMFTKIWNDDFLEVTDFRDWQYGTPFSSLREDKINIAILNPEGIEIIEEEQTKNVEMIVVYLKVLDKIRIKRSLNREKEPDIEEIFNRWKRDCRDFDEFPSHLELTNNDEKDFKKNMKILNNLIKVWYNEGDVKINVN